MKSSSDGLNPLSEVRTKQRWKPLYAEPQRRLSGEHTLWRADGVRHLRAHVENLTARGNRVGKERE